MSCCRVLRFTGFSPSSLIFNHKSTKKHHLRLHSSLESSSEPPQEAVLKLISEVSKSEGRVGQTTNMVLGGTVTHDSTNEWLTLDQKVNSYPTVRGFTAIGTGGDDFVQAMVVAVESVVQHPIPQGHVKQKMSSGGKYVSVNIGPVQVVSSEQVVVGMAAHFGGIKFGFVAASVWCEGIYYPPMPNKLEISEKWLHFCNLF
ncbi:hypothetical protein R6Q59_002923 [Mikania micrantha]